MHEQRARSSSAVQPGEANLAQESLGASLCWRLLLSRFWEKDLGLPCLLQG